MNRIRALRKEKNMTQAELAKVLKVSDRTVGFYETGDRDPDTETLKKLADFFAVSVDYLLGRSELRGFEAAVSKGKDGTDLLVYEKAHGFDEELPAEAKEEIERFKEFIRYKYGKK